MKKFILLFSLALSFFIVGCSQSERSNASPVTVEIGSVKTQLWQNNLSATGTLSAVQGTQFKSELQSRVTKIYFHSGQQVHTGDPLIELNPDVLEAEYQSALATAKLAESNYQRSIILNRQKFISKADFDKARFNKDSADALAKASASKLAMAKITAPFDGTIGLQLVNVGDYTTSGTPLFNLEQLDRLRVDFQIPGDNASQVKLGDRVELRVKNDRQKIIEGTITGKNTAIDPETRMLSLQAIITNDLPHTLLPGSFVEVTLFYGIPHSVMVVPQTAILDEGNTHKVFQVIKGIAKKVPVTIGQRFNDQIIIESGLKPGDDLVINGLVKVNEGDAVVNFSNAN